MTSCLYCGHHDAGSFLFCPRCGTKAAETAGAGDPLLGRTLNGKYRIESEIGSGAMGTVYLGEHIGLKKKVALKVLRSDLEVSDESLQRFQREGIAAGKFNHPHAIQIFDFDKGEGRIFYLAMEFVDGSNLTAFLEKRGRLPVVLAVGLARQVISCLAEAHRHGIVHRDLKPDNIMVVEDLRGELRVKVLDFGLSKLVDRRLESSLVTQPGRLLGTPLYMSPEQVAGEEADARSDVYAAGLILYEMLAGQRPFRVANTTQLFLSRPTQEAPSLLADHPELDIPEELDRIIGSALQRAREDRYQSAEEMLQALDDAALDSSATGRRLLDSARANRSRAPAAPRESSPARAPEVPAPSQKPARKPGILVLAGVGALALLLAGLWTFGRPGRAASTRVRALPADERSEAQNRYLGQLDSARAALRAGDPVRAISAVDEALHGGEKDAEALLVRAEVYRARGDDDTALADYRAAAREDASYADPHLGIFWIQFERGAFDLAAESLERAVELAPDSAGTLAAQGALADRNGDRQAAKTFLQRAVERDPTSTPAQLQLGRILLDEGDADGAITALVEAKRNDSRSARALAWLGEAYLSKGRLDQADGQLAEALRIDPTDAGVHALRASLLIANEQTKAALELLEESVQRHPREARLWFLRGAALEKSDPAGAISALEKGLALDPEDTQARLLLGVLQHRAGKLDEAALQYSGVIERIGDLPLANLDLGLVLFQQGRYAEAAERFEKVIAFDVENAPAHFHLGLLHMDYLGDAAKAVEHFRSYVELGGTDARVAGWINSLQRGR